MNKLKISTRLIILIGLLSVLLVGIGGLGLFAIGQSNQALKSVFEDHTVPAAQLGDIQSLVLHNRLNVNIALVSPTAEIIKERSAAVEANIAAIGKAWDTYMAAHLTPEEAILAKTFAEDRRKLVQEGLLPTLAALRANDLKEAQRLVAEKVRPLAAPVEADSDALIKLQLDEARQLYTEAEERYATIRLVSITAIAGGLLFAVLFGVVMVRSISRQLGAEPGEAASVAQGVAAGDFSLPIALRPDDSGSLMAQLKEMQARLSQVVANVRQGAEGVATASAQIAQGNHELSSRTEQQASALQETAASMEQLSTTVKQNADNARQANQLAQQASSVAVKGGDVVARVVDTMKEINDSSRKIADIISVIDGIAFQTNILALNAAVEAARAGEQGRGFAVVASEVRSLAGRSADAAKEIKGLIGASVERVAQGTALVDEAGVTMTEVVTSIQRVTDIMGEISAASGEQSQGVAQIGEAVMQMDQVTQQNAALVEEMAAAAASLKSQAQDLVSGVAIFKLADGQATQAVRHPPTTHAPAARVAAAPTLKLVGAAKTKAPARAKTPSLAPPAGQPADTPAGKAATQDWESF